MSDDKSQGFLDRLDELKDDLAKHFDELRLGKDELLRVHAAIDTASAAVRSVGQRQAHDLNDELAEKPEDHPREQGQGERPPINTDDNVNQASPEGQVQPVISGAPVDAPAESDEPHAPLPG